MTKRALNETQMVDKLFDAISSGDASAINDAMELELDTDVQEEDTAPVEETPGAETDTQEQQEETTPTDGTEDKAPPQEKDWRDLLPEDIKDKVLSEFTSLASEAKRLDQYYRSNEGRVSGLQKKIDLLQSQLSSVQTLPTKPTANQPAATAEADPVLEALKENDPALYNALEVIRQKEREQYKQEVDKVRAELNQAIAPIHQDRERDYVMREAEKVKQAIPEIEKVVTSPEWGAFINSTNDKVRQLAESRSADEFLSAVEVFTMYLHRNNPQPAPAAPVSNTAARVQESRAKRLATSTPVTRQAALTQGEELGEADLLEKMFQDMRKKQGYAN